MNQAIVILHGYNSSPISTKGIERSLKSWGEVEQVLNLNLYGSMWGFFSTEYNLSSSIAYITPDNQVELDKTIVENVHNRLREELDRSIEIIHCIGHSMGGLVWRTLVKAIYMEDKNNWLWKTNSPQIGSITMLATPNQGSKLTNMTVIETFDRITSAIFLNLVGYPKKIARSLARKFGFMSDEKPNTEVETGSDLSEQTQLQQMKPGSTFLNWLNSPPTYVREIPHYIYIGKRNRLFFSNLAWIKTPEKLDKEDLLGSFSEDFADDDIEMILNKIENNDFENDEQLRKMVEELDLEEELDDVLDDDDDSNILSKMFKSDNVVPNDGMVSVNDAYLPGAELVNYDDEMADKLTHWGLCMWYLPFKQFSYIENRVKEKLKVELNRYD